MTADVFERHVRRFDEVLGFLERVAETPWERFRDDPEKYGSAERFLQVAVEVLNDLGAHVVARSGGEPVGAYRDVPRRLLEAGVLDEEEADVWRRVIGFRNVVVNEYLEVDRAIVYDVLQHRLSDLRDLMRALLRGLAEG
ncbi:MAG: DUF86 domain-containing protein [Trueperaceae bacterium]|nr:DUF86 domain-containing protein [Trueperaceae bacterium]